MSDNWYPEQVRVGPQGTHTTYNFMKTVYEQHESINYAEFGTYKGDTARNVCEIFSRATLYLFDFHVTLKGVREKLLQYDDRIHYFGNTQKFNDSYNWSLMKIIAEQKGQPLFDYCFLDGAHTVAVDALNFFLCDKLLKVGGYMDFDDYGWRLRGSSLDPAKIPAIAEQYTDEQIDAYQVKMIVDTLVEPDRRYKSIVTHKIYQKISD